MSDEISSLGCEGCRVLKNILRSALNKKMKAMDLCEEFIKSGFSKGKYETHRKHFESDEEIKIEPDEKNEKIHWIVLKEEKPIHFDYKLYEKSKKECEDQLEKLEEEVEDIELSDLVEEEKVVKKNNKLMEILEEVEKKENKNE